MECPGIDLDFELRAFTDFWRAKSGKDAAKKDWDATWRNWVREAFRRQQSRNGQSRAPIDSPSGSWFPGA